MVKNDSHVIPSLHRGNIALILVLAAAWLPHILFFLWVEFSIYIDRDYIFIGSFTLCVASVAYCKYMWPFVLISATDVLHMMMARFHLELLVLLASILILLIWWFCNDHSLGRLGVLVKLYKDIKYFWTNKVPGKNLRIILVLILVFIISIPYWISLTSIPYTWDYY